jgi:superfamily II DNA helicase RecQ
MARSKPTTLVGMGGIHGVGEMKLKLYGEEFLDVIRRHGRADEQRRAD